MQRCRGLLDPAVARVRELVKVYEGLPGGVGFIGASIMKRKYPTWRKKAIASGDVVEMAQAYQELKRARVMAKNDGGPGEKQKWIQPLKRKD